MLKELAKSLVQAKLGAISGKPVEVKLSIPVDGSVEQAKFLRVVEQLSSREQRHSVILIKKTGGSPHAFEDFLQALQDLVGPKIVAEVIEEIRSKQTHARAGDLDLSEFHERMARPTREIRQSSGYMG